MPNFSAARRSWVYLPALAWAGLIASLSTTANLPHVPLEWLSPDKIGHLVFYAILTGWLFWGGLRWQETQTLSALYLWGCVGLAFLYGAALEGVQARLPHRQFDYADMMANGVGAVLALLYWQYRHRKP